MGRWRLAVMSAVLLALLAGAFLLGGVLLRDGGPPAEVTETPAPAEAPDAASTPSEVAAGTEEPVEEVVLLAAGDIASCDSEGDPAEDVQNTAALVERLLEDESREAMVAALGDLVLDGSEETYQDCYHPTWGAFRDITMPTIGNHDLPDDMEAYFDYWDHLEMPEPGGYYGYQHGDWHVFVLHTNCGRAGGCDEGDPQVDWLEEELEDIDSGNILAYWHKPRFTIGKHGEYSAINDAYELLEDAGADLILSGHNHSYQRWAPRSYDGTLTEDAPRQFVVGTGGHPLRSLEDSDDDLETEGLEFYQDQEHGLLRLELEACAYRWEFITVDGEVLDDGRIEDTCADG